MLQTVRSWLIRGYMRNPRLREAVARAVYGDKDRTVELFGTPVTINTLREDGYFRASRHARNNILFRDEAVRLQRLACLFRANSLFLDVGGNIGIYSSLAAPLAKILPGFEVHAFEANPDTYRRLSVNAARLGFTANNFAVAAQPGELTFVEGAASGVCTLVEMANAYNIPGRVFTIPAKRLDSLGFAKPMVIKIDVEGQEYNVLEGASGCFDAGLVDAVYIDGYSDARVWDFLEGRGFILLDCGTLDPATRDTFSLLALNPRRLEAGNA